MGNKIVVKGKGAPKCTPGDESGCVHTRWKVRLYTGDKPNAGTDAKVFIRVKGENGWTEDIPLGNKPGQLKTGTMVEFPPVPYPPGNDGKVCGVLLPVEEVTVWHDNSGTMPDWFLEKVELLCVEPPGKTSETSETLTFFCAKWLSLNKDDRKLHQTLQPI